MVKKLDIKYISYYLGTSVVEICEVVTKSNFSFTQIFIKVKRLYFLKRTRNDWLYKTR